MNLLEIYLYNFNNLKKTASEEKKPSSSDLDTREHISRLLPQLAAGLPAAAVAKKLYNYYENNPAELMQNIRRRNTLNAVSPFLDEIDPNVLLNPKAKKKLTDSRLHKLKKSLTSMAGATEAQKYLAIPALMAAYYKTSVDPESDLSKAAPWLAAIATPGSLAAPTAISSGIQTIRQAAKHKRLGAPAWKDVSILKNVVPKAMIPGLLSVGVPALVGGLVEWNRRKAAEQIRENLANDNFGNIDSQNNKKDYSKLLKKLKERRGEI